MWSNLKKKKIMKTPFRNKKKKKIWERSSEIKKKNNNNFRERSADFFLNFWDHDFFDLWFLPDFPDFWILIPLFFLLFFKMQRRLKSGLQKFKKYPAGWHGTCFVVMFSLKRPDQPKRTPTVSLYCRWPCYEKQKIPKIHQNVRNICINRREKKPSSVHIKFQNHF